MDPFVLGCRGTLAVTKPEEQGLIQWNELEPLDDEYEFNEARFLRGRCAVGKR